MHMRLWRWEWGVEVSDGGCRTSKSNVGGEMQLQTHLHTCDVRGRGEALGKPKLQKTREAGAALAVPADS